MNDLLDCRLNEVEQFFSEGITALLGGTYVVYVSAWQHDIYCTTLYTQL